MANNSSSRPSRELIFFSTGSFAGVCSATADFGFDKLSSMVRGTPARPVDALVRNMLPHIIKPGIRFWGFDMAKSVLLTEDMPVSLRGGLAGSIGGFIEMSSANLYAMYRPGAKNRPTLPVASRMSILHSGKLFLCFGTYTYLANTYSQRLPPRPFSYCLMLGALAGGFGTTLITPVEMYVSSRIPLKFSQVLKVAVTRAPRGAVSVGTVIAVQVTLSAWLLEQS